MLMFRSGVTSTYICFEVLGYSKSWITFTSQKEARAEAGVARGDGVVVGQEDMVRPKVGAVAEEAMEVVVVVEALGIAEAEDTGEITVVSEGHDLAFKHSKHAFAPSRSLNNV
jgi:sorbitol-specific phosphotransferase system component IIA